MENLISVIIPVYNVEAYLARCLRSVIDNTYRDLEIICINDGSTDNSALILEEFAQMDPRIRVITSVNAGVAAARNKGIRAAKGQYIAFIDSDDWIHPDYFELMLSCIHKYGSDLVICDAVRTETQTPYPALSADSVSTECQRYDQIGGDRFFRYCVWGKLFPAGLIKCFAFVEERRVMEDVLFMNDIFFHNPDMTACHIRKELYYYFDRPGSTSSGVGYNGVFLTAQAYCDKAQTAGSEQVKKRFAIAALKQLLSARYWLKKDRQKAHRAECDALLKKMHALLMTFPGLSAKERMMYTVLYKIPLSYAVGVAVKEWRSKSR